MVCRGIDIKWKNDPNECYHLSQAIIFVRMLKPQPCSSSSSGIGMYMCMWGCDRLVFDGDAAAVVAATTAAATAVASKHMASNEM